MKRILAQAVKEWRQFGRDRLTLALAGLLPIVMLFLFGTALALDPDNLTLAVEDLDNTPTSRRYLETYAATQDLVLVARTTSGPLADSLDSGRARMALQIPGHFERDLLRGTPTQVQVLIDGTDANTANALRNTAKAVNQAFVTRRLGAAAQSPSVRAQMRFWYNPGLSDRRFFGSGALGLVLILFPALLGALAVAREHENGTIIQAYASTLTAPQWLLGKAIPYVLVGAAEFVICFVVGAAMFNYRLPPDPTPFLLGTAFYIIAAVFYGMAVGNVMGTQSAAIQAVQLGAFLISMLLSGFLVPVSNMPVELRWISYILPATYYVHITRDAFLRSGGWVSMGGSVAVLALMCLFFFGANLRTMRRMQFSD
jgi:drug efflux transport system permease protein